MAIEVPSLFCRNFIIFIIHRECILRLSFNTFLEDLRKMRKNVHEEHAVNIYKENKKVIAFYYKFFFKDNALTIIY